MSARWFQVFWRLQRDTMELMAVTVDERTSEDRTMLRPKPLDRPARSVIDRMQSARSKHVRLTIRSCIFGVLLIADVCVIPSTANSQIATTQVSSVQRTNVRTGGSLVGPTKRSTKLKLVVVGVDSELSIALPESRVSQPVPPELLASYRNRVEATKRDDVDEVYELAKWCGKNRLREQRRYWMQRVIVLDPNHGLARQALGYVEHSGRWVEFEVLQRKFGLVNVSGNSWEVPEIIAREKAADEYDRASKLWKKNLQRMITAMQRAPQEAFAELNAISDPMASQAIADRLEGSLSDAKNLRLLWVRLLGRLRTKVAVQALVKAGWQEPDRRVREACLEQLQDYGRSSAVATYTAILQAAVEKKKTSPAEVQRAALALQYFPEPEQALIYADALVTEQVQIGPPGAQMNIGFGNAGAGGMQAGGGQNVQVQKSENLEVRNLLKKIEPGTDYGYDEVAWKLHFAGKRSRFSGDLRRDP